MSNTFRRSATTDERDYRDAKLATRIRRTSARREVGVTVDDTVVYYTGAFAISLSHK